VLRTESRRDLQVAQGRERVEAVPELAGDRRRMREQRDAASRERLAQRGVVEQPFDAELQASSSANASAWWKSGLPGAWRSAQ